MIINSLESYSVNVLPNHATRLTHPIISSKKKPLLLISRLLGVTDAEAQMRMVINGINSAVSYRSVQIENQFTSQCRA